MTPPPVLRGMLLLARGRAEGLNCFRDTPRAFLGSLTPGLGFLAGAVVEGLLDGLGPRAFGEALAPLCALLAPPVLSYEIARLFGREAFWGRYIVAFNWCQWLLPVLGMVLLTALTLARQSGLSGGSGLKLAMAGFAGYALWLNWFIARNGLALTPLRAGVLVFAVNAGTVLLAFGPSMLVAQ